MARFLAKLLVVLWVSRWLILRYLPPQMGSDVLLGLIDTAGPPVLTLFVIFALIHLLFR